MKLGKITFASLSLVLLYFAVLLGLLVSSVSCSAIDHLKKADKHTKKAIAKGAVIKSDTAYKYIYKTDTLYKDGKVLKVYKTIVDSIPYEVTNTVTVPKYMSRQERKALKDSLRHAENMYALQTKRADKMSKRNTQLQKELRKGENSQIKQNIKLAKLKKRTGPTAWVNKLIALGCIIAFFFILSRIVLPK